MGGMTFFGLTGTGAITFFPVCVTVTIAVAETVVTVIAITHNKELIALSRSALTDQPQLTLIYAIVSVAYGARTAIVPDSVS